MSTLLKKYREFLNEDRSERPITEAFDDYSDKEFVDFSTGVYDDEEWLRNAHHSMRDVLERLERFMKMVNSREPETSFGKSAKKKIIKDMVGSVNVQNIIARAFLATTEEMKHLDGLRKEVNAEWSKNTNRKK